MLVSVLVGVAVWESWGLARLLFRGVGLLPPQAVASAFCPLVCFCGWRFLHVGSVGKGEALGGKLVEGVCSVDLLNLTLLNEGVECPCDLRRAVHGPNNLVRTERRLRLSFVVTVAKREDDVELILGHIGTAFSHSVEMRQQ